MSKKSLTFIDLFCGCGGFSYGMELAGHKCLLGVDFEKDAIESFKENHKKAETFLGDIKKLTNRKLDFLLKGKKIDMVIGGPPCQGFSTVGKGKADDDRNTLFKEFVRVVAFLDPKIVMFENVTGMLAKKNEKVLKAIFKSFEDLGYTMSARVMAAEEYGVPEKRRRAIIIGTKKCAFNFPKMTHGARGSQKLMTVKKALLKKNLKASDGKIYNHDISLAEIKNELDKKRIQYIPAGSGVRYERDENKYLPKKLRFDINWETLRENRFRQTKLQRLPLDEPGPTILTSRTTYYHPIENRFLTPREAAAVQSFPGDFIFKGSVTSQFKQIGNAVPPMLAKTLGEEAAKLKANKHAGKQKEQADFKKKAFTYSELTYAS